MVKGQPFGDADFFGSSLGHLNWVVRYLPLGVAGILGFSCLKFNRERPSGQRGQPEHQLAQRGQGRR